MNFELGKEYIVKVSKEGIIPIEEFDKSKFYDKDHDDLDFLTDEEKMIVINDVLEKIKAEIEQLPTNSRINWNGCCPDIEYPEIEYVDVTKAALLGIIEKYKAKSEPEPPQPKMRQWLYGEDLETGRDGWYCNQCGHFEPWDYSLDMEIAELNLPNRCPKCRAKMQEVKMWCKDGKPGRGRK